MATVEHRVLMHGKAVRAGGAVPAAAGAVLALIDQSLHGAVDMAFRRASGAGRRRAWLRSAGQVDFVHGERTGAEEMALFFQSQPFGEIAKEYFAQPSLFPDRPQETDTAFDVLADAVGDVLDRKTDSERYDTGLLRRFHRFQASVFDKDVSELVFSGHRVPEASPCRLSREFTERAKELYLQTPEPSRVRVAGKLDMVQASTLAFELLLPNGDRVRGVWKGDEFETLRALANTDVVASGMAVFRPSGVLLRVDADALTPPRPEDGFFATVPLSSGNRLNLQSLIRAQQKRGGVAAMWGRIPAEESDEVFLTAISEMD